MNQETLLKQLESMADPQPAGKDPRMLPLRPHLQAGPDFRQARRFRICFGSLILIRSTRAPASSHISLSHPCFFR